MLQFTKREYHPPRACLAGGSLASFQALEPSGGSGASRFPVVESSSSNLIPLQNEPNDIQTRPSSSRNIAGSIALNLSAFPERTTIPSSRQPYSGFAGPSVVAVANPIADVFTPNDDTE